MAEESVVASLMVDEEAIHKVVPILRVSDFYRETNGWTYEACLALSDRGDHRSAGAEWKTLKQFG